MDRNEFIARYMIALADSDNHFETDADIAISAADELEERIPNIFTKRKCRNIYIANGWLMS